MENNKMKKEYFDAVVIGGGASGMMAAIVASQDGAKIALLEKNNTLGRKLLLTGNGRCNLTHAGLDNKEFIEKIGQNGKFLFSSLSTFGPQETMRFFESLGLKLKTEKGGRVFPKNNKAQEVLDVLARKLEKNGVKIMLNQNVKELGVKNENIEYASVETRLTASLQGETKIHAKNFILAAGGKSYPATGSSGEGYNWLLRMGHKVNSPTPALVPVKIKESWAKELQGISLKNAGINLIFGNKKINLGSGEIIFTHFGLSGPAIINASKSIGQYLKKGKVILSLDLFPALNLTEFQEKLKIDFEENKKRNLKNYLAEIFPQKLAQKLMELSGIESERKINTTAKSERLILSQLIKDIRITAEALLDFNHAMVTSGGVSLKEVDPKTMRSKIIENLFFCGEILDLDGPTGGYNLQIAWATGHAAGEHAKK